MESSLVSDDLDSSLGQLAVVVHFQHLTKGALSKYAENFVSIGQMVSNDCLVVASVIIESPVVLCCTIDTALQSDRENDQIKQASDCYVRV